MKRTAMSVLMTAVVTVALAQAVWRLYPPPTPATVTAATAAEVYELRAAIAQLNERYAGLSSTVKEAVSQLNRLDAELTARDAAADAAVPEPARRR
jgi:hypothetical protein